MQSCASASLLLSRKSRARITTYLSNQKKTVVCCSTSTWLDKSSRSPLLRNPSGQVSQETPLFIPPFSWKPCTYSTHIYTLKCTTGLHILKALLSAKRAANDQDSPLRCTCLLIPGQRIRFIRVASLILLFRAALSLGGRPSPSIRRPFRASVAPPPTPYTSLE